MTDLDDGFGLGDFKHLVKQDQTAVYDVTGLLVLEREIVLVSKERLVGSGGDMVLENVEDQLIDDPELNLVSAHKPDVVRGSAVEANNGSIIDCTERSIKRHVIGSIEPLGEMLAGVSRSTRVVKLTFITCSPPESEVECLSKRPSPSIGTDMRGPQR